MAKRIPEVQLELGYGGNSKRARGKVQRVYRERGFGFIRCTLGGEVGADYFFHASGLDDCPIEDLEEGSAVTFEAHQVAKGKRAEHIQKAEMTGAEP